MPITSNGGGVLITGNAINWYAVLAAKHGGEFYLKHGMVVNRAYTPANLRRFAEQYTGKHYNRSRKGLEAAVKDLQKLLDTREPDEFERK